eukprot:1788292-Pleurochrysis_carterae.AAC.2
MSVGAEIGLIVSIAATLVGSALAVFVYLRCRGRRNYDERKQLAENVLFARQTDTNNMFECTISDHLQPL